MNEILSFQSADTGRGHVDFERGVITGFKVATLGEAKGHGLFVDAVTLEQLIELGNAKGTGVKVRFTHPENSDGLGSLVGWAKNFRHGNNCVLADLFLSDVAKQSPRGDLYSYVLKLADKAPSSFGASMVVKYSRETVAGQKLPSIRLTSLTAVDLVDDPAANNGLFSSRDDVSLAAMPENSKYVTEYVLQEEAYMKARITVDEYIQTRRIDDGLDVLQAKGKIRYAPWNKIQPGHSIQQARDDFAEADEKLPPGPFEVGSDVMVIRGLAKNS